MQILKLWCFKILYSFSCIPAYQDTQVWSLGGEDPWEKAIQSTPIFLLEEFHGLRSLMGYSPWGRKEMGMAGWLTLALA